MPEEQLVALPPELRQMVMASANTLMNGGNNGNMMPMMDMAQMQQMNMMGMNSMDGNMMGQGGPGIPMGQGGMMQESAGPVVGPEGAMMSMQDGFGPGGGPGMMNMNMGDGYGMQVRSLP
jgi:pre-mRNA 3'-end-processing factor FIP1